jgi:predicted dehydrogenase
VTLRFGIVGAGRMAVAMARAMAMAPGVAAVAAASASSSAAASARAEGFARAAGIPCAHGDLAALLADPEVDAVYVANATARHAETAMAALAAGKAVLCEKPFAVSAAEGAAVLAAARAAGRPFMEALWTPFLPAHRRLAALAASGELGRPRHLQASFGYPADPAAHPALFAGPGAGAMLDRGVYDIALALRLLGPAETVEAQIEAGPDGTDGTDLTASLQIAHAGGAQSQIACSIVALLGNTAILGCERGSASLPAPSVPAETVAVARAGAVGTIGAATARPDAGGRLKETLRRSPALRRLRRGLRGGVEAHGYGAHPHLPMLLHFRDLAASGGLESAVVPQAASLAVLSVIDAARGDGARRDGVRGTAQGTGQGADRRAEGAA